MAQDPPGGVLRTAQTASLVAHTEQETEVIPFGEYSARSPVDCNLPRHKVGAWMVVEGRGNNRGEGLGIWHVSKQ